MKLGIGMRYALIGSVYLVSTLIDPRVCCEEDDRALSRIYTSQKFVYTRTICESHHFKERPAEALLILAQLGHGLHGPLLLTVPTIETSAADQTILISALFLLSRG